MTGSGFGRRGARENSLYASLAGSEGVWGDFDGLAGRFSSRLEWVSETSVKGVVPAGVGAEVRVLLRLQVRYKSWPLYATNVFN